MSIATLEVTGLKIGIAAAVLAGACAATWFAADSHYSQALSSLEGQLRGAAAAQKTAVDAQIATDQAAAKEVNDAAQTQIGNMAGTISDLSNRLQHAAGSHTITVRPAAPGPTVACVQPDRPAAAASSGPVPEPAKPTAGTAGSTQTDVAAIPADVLDGVLLVGIDALKAELLWREYVRKTGQVK